MANIAALWRNITRWVRNRRNRKLGLTRELPELSDAEFRKIIALEEKRKGIIHTKQARRGAEKLPRKTRRKE